MDDVKLGFSLFILLLVFLTMLARAAELEYITVEQKNNLENLFEKGKLEVGQLRVGQAWNCDMYGVRSRLQVQHGLKLYNWGKSENHEWHNDGAQVVHDYQVRDSALVGESDRFQDQVKMGPNGQLISRLTLKSGEHPVLAYAVCKSL